MSDQRPLRSPRRARTLLGAFAASLACVLGLAIANWPARAAFPGSNGKIVYSALSEWDDYDVFVINADGSALANLTSFWSDDEAPAVSPDGSKIAFTSNRDGNREIYLIDADGTNLARLTHNAATDYGPAFSADGSTLAFTSDRDGNREIYAVAADGSGETRLTTSAANEDGPTFSADGTRLAFTSDRDGNPEIYVAAADGTNPVRLTADPAADYAPDFTPDGSTIVFTSNRGGGAGHIYRMGADGSAPAMLTSGETSFDHDPSFSPDGTKIVFASDFYCPSVYQCGDMLGGVLSVIDSDGTGEATVISGALFANPAWGVATPGTPTPTTSPDTTPPTTTSPDSTAPETNITAGPTGPTNNPSPSFAFTGTDDRTATAQLQYAYRLDDGAWSTYSSDTTATLTVADGAHIISVKARDEAGNEDPTPAQRAFTVDTVAPTGTATIQGGAVRTRTLNVTLSLIASDPPPASGVTEMRVSNSASGLTSAIWNPYTPIAQWTLSPGAGTKTVYVQYRDAAATPLPSPKTPSNTSHESRRRSPMRRTGGTMRKTAVGCLLAAGVLWFPTTHGAAAEPATLVVDRDGVECANAEFTSIQAAVDAAQPGDLIRVCPDLYTETVVVDKPLTLQADPDAIEAIDCFQPTLGELPADQQAIVDPAGEGFSIAFKLEADHVELAGFVVQGATVGIDASDRFSGYRLHHNLIRLNTLFGVDFGSEGTHQSRVDHNCIRDALLWGLVSELDDDSLWKLSDGPERDLWNARDLRNARLDHNNTFRNGGPVLGVGLEAAGPGQRDQVTFDHNVSREDSQGIALSNATRSAIVDNEIIASLRHSMILGGAVDGVEVRANTVRGGGITGVRFARAGFIDVFSRSRNVLVTGNDVTGMDGSGIFVVVDNLTDSTISENITSGNDLSGIGVGPGNTRNTIRDNQADNNGAFGIEVRLGATGNSLQRNSMHGNAIYDASDLNRPLNEWVGNDCDTDFPTGMLCGVG